MTGWQTLCPEYVIYFFSVCVCGSLHQSCLPGKSANYNIKAVSSSDLFAFALYAITLNQERSAVDVGPMQKLPPPPRLHPGFCLYKWILITPLHKHMAYHPCDFALLRVFVLIWHKRCVFSAAQQCCLCLSQTRTAVYAVITFYLFSFMYVSVSIIDEHPSETNVDETFNFIFKQKSHHLSNSTPTLMNCAMFIQNPKSVNLYLAAVCGTI